MMFILVYEIGIYIFHYASGTNQQIGIKLEYMRALGRNSSQLLTPGNKSRNDAADFKF